MLLWLLHFFTGQLRLRVRGAYLERFLNICALNGITLYDINRIAVDEIYVFIDVHHFKPLKELARKTHCKIHILEKKGFPFMLYRIRGRYMLFAGILLFLVTVYFVWGYIWIINIDAPEGMNEREIIQNLSELGVKVGVPVKDIDAESIKNDMMLKMDNLAFFAINVIGNEANVEVEMRVPKPEMMDEDTITSIVSRKTGVITKMDVKGGTPMKKVGDTVLSGEMIVDAKVNPIKEIDDIYKPMLVHSFGDIQARTWYNTKRILSTKTSYKQYTEKVKTKYALVIGKKRINLFFGSGIAADNCDKIVDIYKVKINDNLTVPVHLVKQTYVMYEKVEDTLTADMVQKFMEQMSEESMKKLIDGEILSSSHTIYDDEGVIVLESAFECLENIGQEVYDDRTIEDINQPEKEGQLE